jgi:hypothetical protein
LPVSGISLAEDGEGSRAAWEDGNNKPNSKVILHLNPQVVRNDSSVDDRIIERLERQR